MGPVLDFESYITGMVYVKWIHHIIIIANFLPKSKNSDAKMCTNCAIGHITGQSFDFIASLPKLYGQKPY